MTDMECLDFVEEDMESEWTLEGGDWQGEKRGRREWGWELLLFGNGEAVNPSLLAT